MTTDQLLDTLRAEGRWAAEHCKESQESIIRVYADDAQADAYAEGYRGYALPVHENVDIRD